MDALKLLSRSTGLKSQLVRSSVQKLPSSSGRTATQEPSENLPGRKRKRDSDETGNGAQLENARAIFLEEEIRQLHKNHKIKIVDLNRFRGASKSSGSRKSQKERSRIYPQPLTSFSLLRSQHSVNANLAHNVLEQGFNEPTEVQTATLPLLLKDNNDDSPAEPDLLTVAPTGSGKTLAFLIPLIEKISRKHRHPGGEQAKHVSAIILAPTKELVSQIVNEGRKLTLKTGVGITGMRKGMMLFESESGSEEEFEDESDTKLGSDDEKLTKFGSLVKTDILVSTPLSLVHVLCPSWEDDESVPPHPLPNITSLIFDEADVLLDPLFRPQTLAIWSACTSPSLRISMWSATIGSNIEELAVRILSERQKRLQIPRDQGSPLLRTIIGLKDTSLPTISHRLVYTATESGKLLGMRQLLHPSRSTTSPKREAEASTPLRPPFLVFTQTITRAQSLYNELQYDIPALAGGSSRIAVFHSSLPNHSRSVIMQNFRQGKIWLLITTDLLSRGVDFRGVNVVVNYDIPTTVAGYVHRAGRTGRAGSEGGVCVSFYTKEDVRYVKGIANVIAASEEAQVKLESATMSTQGYKASASKSPRTSNGIQPWPLHALPSVPKTARKDLKLHGVESRRAIHADDDEKTKRMKRKARIGTQSGHERREANRKRGAVEGSLRAKRKEQRQMELKDEHDDWVGFD